VPRRATSAGCRARRAPRQAGRPRYPAHEEDKDDQNLPLMDWYAAESIVAADPVWAAEALGACKIPKVAEFIARRMAEK